MNLIVSFSKNADMKSYFEAYCEAYLLGKYAKPAMFFGYASGPQGFQCQIPSVFKILLAIAKSPWKIQFVHSTDASPYNIILALIAQVLKFKLVTDLHDVNPHPEEGILGIKSYFVRLYNYLILNVFDVSIVCRSENQRSILRRNAYFVPLVGLPERPQVLPNDNSEILRIAVIGRIRPYKNLALWKGLLSIAERLGIKVHLTIAGEGYDPALVYFYSMPNVTILNRHIEESEWERVLDQQDYVSALYKSATQSGIIPLSFSFGIPVLVTNCEGLTEQVKDGVNGFIFDDIQDSESFLSKIYQAKKFGLENLRVKARNSYLNSYSKKIAHEKISQFYTVLLDDLNKIVRT